MHHKNPELTRRVDLNLGYSCNEACSFCYYIESIEARNKDRDLSTEEAKHFIRYIHQQGKEVIDFTGGEATIRKDFVELVRYAKQLGFRSLCLITNGSRIANLDYAMTLVEAGIDDFLLSLHGADAKTHDALTKRQGSYDKMMRAIKNVSGLGVKVRTNMVVTGRNYHQVVDMTKKLADLEVKTINFILFNPIVEAGADQSMNVEYRKAAPELMKAIDLYKDRFDKITIRYMPFCNMPGYESYITNMQQIQYDPDEWDYLIRTRIREGWAVSTAALFMGMLLLPSKKRGMQVGWKTAKREGIKYFLEAKNKVKGPQCKSCSLEAICGGVWRNYAKWKGFTELEAVQGAKVYDPTHFMKERLEKEHQALEVVRSRSKHLNKESA